MTITFLEPGGDATFIADIVTAGGFWNLKNGAPVISTDFVHGGHIKSTKFRPGQADYLTKNGVLNGTGSRLSAYIYLAALPSATATFAYASSSGNDVAAIRLTSAGVLQLWSDSAQIGTNGPTLSTGVWYRISLAFTVSSTSVNEFRLFKDSSLAISVTNATLGFNSPTDLIIGNGNTNSTLDFRISDIYVDQNNSLADPGNIWVTAKRPVASGINNDWTTQIGSGGSGYGTGHSPQVNERALSTANGWSIQASTDKTEAYAVEAKSVGDINVSSATFVDAVGWVCAKADVSSAIKMVVEGVNHGLTLPTAYTVLSNVGGFSDYPAGGNDIGLYNNSVNHLFSLVECGILVAYIPSIPSALSDSIMNADSRLAVLSSLKVVSAALSDSIMNAASRLASLANIQTKLWTPRIKPTNTWTPRNKP